LAEIILIFEKEVKIMFFLKKISKIKALKLASGLPVIIFLIVFSIVFLMPQKSQAQITVFDPVSAGIQAVIQQITAANTAIQAAESHIEVELSALKYVRQGQQLMNQIQQLQQESSSLIGAVNNIEGTVMMPANELAGLKNTLTGEEATMQNIINLEKNNPQMEGFLQNYQNTYGTGSINQSSLTAQAQGEYNQASNTGVQAAQTAAYGQALLNNSQNNQHLISQLGSNVASAKGQVAVGQANGQTLVTIAEEINQLNKLEALKAKLTAMQAGQDASQSKLDAAEAAQAAQNTPVIKPINPSAGNNPFGDYPSVTNFGIGH